MKLHLTNRKDNETVLFIEHPLVKDNRQNGVMFGYWFTEGEAKRFGTDELTICIFRIKSLKN